MPSPQCCSILLINNLNVAYRLFRPMTRRNVTFLSTNLYPLGKVRFASNLFKKLIVYVRLYHCAINRKVAGSIPDGDMGIFHWHNLSGHTMALGSTQPLTEICRVSWNLGPSTSWNPQGLIRPVMGLLYLLTSLEARFFVTNSSRPFLYKQITYVYSKTTRKF